LRVASIIEAIPGQDFMAEMPAVPGQYGAKNPRDLFLSLDQALDSNLIEMIREERASESR
jgi:hypothetical protein